MHEVSIYSWFCRITTALTTSTVHADGEIDAIEIGSAEIEANAASTGVAKCARAIFISLNVDFNNHLSQMKSTLAYEIWSLFLP
jgi:hypothetical protein